MKLKILALVILVSVVALWPARASAATYYINPGTLTRLSGGGCTVDFAYSTRPPTPTTAVAKIKHVPPSTCHADTYVQVIATNLDTWQTIYGLPCFITPDPACAEADGWSVSKASNSSALGAFLYLCGAAETCQEHLVIQP